MLFGLPISMAWPVANNSATTATGKAKLVRLFMALFPTHKSGKNIAAGVPSWRTNVMRLHL